MRFGGHLAGAETATNVFKIIQLIICSLFNCLLIVILIAHGDSGEDSRGIVLLALQFSHLIQGLLVRVRRIGLFQIYVHKT